MFRYDYLTGKFGKDLLALACVNMAVLVVAAFYFYMSPGGERYPSTLFVPSILFALGEGFHNTDVAALPALQEFLAGQRPALGREDIAAAAYLPLDSDQAYQFYQLCFATLWLICFGVSWSTIHGITTLHFCITCSTVYLLCRQFMRSPYALLGSLAMLIQPAMVLELYFPRDFGKAPFAVALIAVFILLLGRPQRKASLLRFSVLIGLLLGIGIGFRRDLLIFTLPAVFAILASQSPGYTGYRLKSAALALALSIFACVGAPVFYALSHHGSLFWHDTLMGFAQESDDLLGVHNAAYTRLQWRDDMLVYHTASAAWERHQGLESGAMPPSDTERAKRHLLVQYACTFPADILTRAYASTMAIFLFLLPGLPKVAAIPLLIIPFAVLLGIARRGTATAWKLFFLAAFLCAYSSIQFESRHALHLLALPCLCIALTASALGDSLSGRWNLAHKPATRQLAWFAALLLVLLAFPLGALRVVQNIQVSNMAEAITAKPAIELPAITREMGTFRLTELQQPLPLSQCYEDSGTRAAYLRATCLVSSPGSRLWMVYDANIAAGMALNTSLRVDPSGISGGLVHFYFPIYEENAPNRWSRFRGLVCEEGGGVAVQGLALVEHAEQLPLHPIIALEAASQELVTCQRLSLSTASIEIQPLEAVNPYERLAQELVESNYAAEAEHVWEYARAIDPANTQVLLRLAGLREQQGRITEAWAAIEQVVAQRPEDCVPQRMLREFLERHRMSQLLPANECCK